MKKNSVVAGILAILCVMSVSGCGDKEAESSTAETTTVVTTEVTETTTQTTTVVTTTEVTTTTKESEGLELGMPFVIESMLVDMPTNLLFTSEENSDYIGGKIYYWKSTEWVIQSSCQKINGTDTDYLMDLYINFDDDDTKTSFCYVADHQAVQVTRKEKNDGISQIGYYIAYDGKLYSLIFCSNNEKNIENAISPILNSVKFSESSETVESTPKNETAQKNEKTQKTDNFNITLLDAKELELEDWMKDDQNKENIILAVYFEFENTSDETCDVGMYNFKAYVDDYAAQEHYVMQNDPDGYIHIDDDIAPGKKAKGYRAFEIPSDWNEFEVTYEDDSKTATFVIDKSLTVN